jgi:hypothetical protein
MSDLSFNGFPHEENPERHIQTPSPTPRTNANSFLHHKYGELTRANVSRIIETVLVAANREIWRLRDEIARLRDELCVAQEASK